MGIIALQDQYLRTGDKRTLSALYEEILKVGFTQFNHEKFGPKVDEKTVYDIASGIIIRLMETQRPIIKGAPSAYMKMAMFYSSKTRSAVSLDELGADIPVDDSYDIYADCTYMAVLASMDIDEDIRPLCEEVLSKRLNYETYKKDLSQSQRNRMNKVMEEVRRRVKAYL